MSNLSQIVRQAVNIYAMGNKVATQAFESKVRCLLRFDIVLDQVFPEGLLAPRGGIVRTRWGVPVHSFFRVTTRQERSTGGKVDINVLTSIGCVVDDTAFAIEGAAVRIPREACGMVHAAKGIQLYSWAVE